LAIWVLTLKEPVRGAIDGLETPEDPAPFSGFFKELVQVIPPLTFIGAFMRGPQALLINVAGALFFAVLAVILSDLVPASSNLVSGISDQWLFLAIGYYAVFSWAAGLRERDRPTFALTWGSPAFLTVIFGYGMVAFMAYAASSNLGCSIWPSGPHTASCDRLHSRQFAHFLCIQLLGKLVDCDRAWSCCGDQSGLGLAENARGSHGYLLPRDDTGWFGPGAVHGGLCLGNQWR